MHRIERYGVIALVLLLVTTTAVALWDSGGGGGGVTQVLAASPQASPQASTPGRSQNMKSSRRPPTRARRVQEVPAPARGVVGDHAELPLSYREGAPDSLAAGRRTLQGISRLGGGSAQSRATTPAADGRAVSGLKPSVHRQPRGMVQPGLATAAAPGKLLRQQSESRTVSVKPGDVLSVICERELGTVRRLDEVIALNPGLDPDRLFVGQKLRLPNTVTQPTLPRVVEASASVPARKLDRIQPEAASFSTYTVRPGDVLSLIAKRELGSVRRMGEIVIANPGLDVDYLVVGQSLRMPGKRQPSSDVALARETRSPVLAQVKRASKPTRGRVR